MVKLGIATILSILFLVSHSETIRMLQFNDTLCAKWTSDGQTCLQCAFRAYYDITSGKCQNVNPNCQTWNLGNGDCVTCYDGYGDAATNGKAINGQCQIFNSTNVPMDQNCKIFVTRDECQECFQGFFVYGGKCFALPLGCVMAENITCVQCAQDYFLTNSSNCVLLSPNCTMANDEGNCTECQTGFYLDELGFCHFLVANCTTTDIYGNCTACDPGMFVNQMKDCVILPENCLRAQQDNVCSQCGNGFFVSSTGACAILPVGCGVANPSGKCTSCNIGYYLSSNDQCAQLPANCSTADINGNCTSCDAGFQLDTTTRDCSQLPPNCAQVNPEGNCTKCTIGYYLNEISDCIQVPPNCITANASGFCEACSLGYQVAADGACVYLPTGCASTQGNNSCTNCLPGWTFNDVMNCVQLPIGCATGTLNGPCTSCLPGYVEVSSGTCLWLPDNCNITDADGICTQCNDGFTLLGGTKQCTPKERQTTQRPDAILDCRTQDQNGNCLTCRLDYNLGNGTCTPNGLNPKCASYSTDLTCTSCYYPEKFYLDNNLICSQNQLDCKVFDIQTGDCTECYIGYILYNGECVLRPQGN